MLLMCRKWHFKSECWQLRERQRELSRAQSKMDSAKQLTAIQPVNPLSRHSRNKRTKNIEDLEKSLNDLLLVKGLNSDSQLFHPLLKDPYQGVAKWADEHDMMVSIKKEYFTILVPQLQLSTLNMMKSPESVACLTGPPEKTNQTISLSDNILVGNSPASATTTRTVIDTCLHTGV